VRLARVHALLAGSDAAVTVALAGSIFFSISPDDARWRVALYLALTMAPFAVVTPLIGPAIDRVAGGRKAMIVTTAAGRLFVTLFMLSNFDSLWLFPLAFTLLVLQKGYAVAKSAVVPRYVQSETNLVDANSRLALISAVVSMLGAAVGGAFSLVGGSSWAAAVGMIGYGVGTVLAFRLPGVRVATAPAEALEKEELRGLTILLAGSAMAVVRGAVGFVTFLLAFEFRGGDESLDVSGDGAAVGGLTATARDIDITGNPAAPVWHFGLVILAAGVGALFGAQLAPRLRTRFSEESMIIGILGGVTVAAMLAALFGGLFGAAVLSFIIATGAGAGKLAFDALVQRDAPDANYGRSFARFEARFQIAWVIGAFVPTVLPVGTAIGSAMVAFAVGFALLSYLLGRAGRPPLHRTWVRNRRKGVAPEGGDGAAPSADVGADPTTVTDGYGTDPTFVAGDHDAAPTAGDDDDTRRLTDAESAPVEETGGPAIPEAPWWHSPVPNVSSVEGVEVDEPSSHSSLPPISDAKETSRPDDES